MRIDLKWSMPPVFSSPGSEDQKINLLDPSVTSEDYDPQAKKVLDTKVPEEPRDDVLDRMIPSNGKMMRRTR
jgi:hypothetical protein